MIEVHQLRDQVSSWNQDYQERMKATFDKNAKARDLQVGDLILKWDAARQKKEKKRKIETHF